MPASQNFFQKVPFVRISVSFMPGILLGNIVNLPEIIVSVIATFLMIFLLLFWDTSHFSILRLLNVLLPLCLIILGIFFSKREAKQSQISSEKDYFLAEILQKPTEKVKTFQTILLIRNPAKPKPEKILAYFSKTDFDTTTSIGDQLIILVRPQTIKNFGNPFEFDYQSMMNRKGIFQSVYLEKGSYQKTGFIHSRWQNKPEQLRGKLMAMLQNSPVKDQNLAVVEALALGYRAELDPETIDYFSSTGAMHVLAVSGLHVGLIYYIIGFFLSGLKKLKGGKSLFPFSIIAFLWLYAFLTGFSPSVQRATVMFTFIVIGESIRRPVNIYNSLAASAFLLMLINPEVIYEVGFQLSYLAVIGIVLIQPPLSSLLQLKNKFLRACWSLFTVSIAAQVATFPLGLFYFNQFPTFFWLSNFVVIPAATVLIWLIFIFFLLSPVPVLSHIIGFVINWITSTMLYLLKTISEMPHALTKGVILNQAETVIIYLVIISLIVFVFSKRKFWLFSIFFLLILLFSTTLYSKYQLVNQRQIFVYNSKKTLIHLINGRNNYLITTNGDTIAPREKKMIENVSNHLKLNDAEIFDLPATTEVKKPDLIIENTELVFLDTEIRIQQKYKKSPVLKISVKDSDTKYLISAGNGTNKAIYYTGQNGAWKFNEVKSKPNPTSVLAQNE